MAVFITELKFWSAVMEFTKSNEPVTRISMLEIKYGVAVGSAVGRAEGSAVGSRVGPVG